MTIDQELIKYIRGLLADDGDEEDRLFSDKAIANVAGKADTINHALYILYTQKAGKVITKEGRVKSIKIGGEGVEKLSCIEMSRAMLDMAEQYRIIWLREKDGLVPKNTSHFIY